MGRGKRGRVGCKEGIMGKWEEGLMVGPGCTLDDPLPTHQVYSRVADRLRVELFDTNPKHDVLINEVLVQEGYAIKCDEPYASRVSPVTRYHDVDIVLRNLSTLCTCSQNISLVSQKLGYSANLGLKHWPWSARKIVFDF